MFIIYVTSSSDLLTRAAGFMVVNNTVPVNPSRTEPNNTIAHGGSSSSDYIISLPLEGSSVNSPTLQWQRNKQSDVQSLVNR